MQRTIYVIITLKTSGATSRVNYELKTSFTNSFDATLTLVIGEIYAAICGAFNSCIITIKPTVQVCFNPFVRNAYKNHYRLDFFTCRLPHQDGTTVDSRLSARGLTALRLNRGNVFLKKKFYFP
jgi:hypothetical protein